MLPDCDSELPNRRERLSVVQLPEERARARSPVTVQEWVAALPDRHADSESNNLINKQTNHESEKQIDNEVDTDLDCADCKRLKDLNKDNMKELKIIS